MKKLLFILPVCLIVVACGNKPKQTPYTEEEFAIRGCVLKSVDSMEYYSVKAAEGDARAQYIMAGSYYCNAEVQPLPVGIIRVHTQAEADSFLAEAAAQNYIPAIRAIECLKECRGESSVTQEDLEEIIERQENTIDSLQAEVGELSALLDKAEGN
jgi:hypothetical protein